MQQRRLRLGDILDDYCPRERRITNHAIVAMIDDDVRQTRCTTCDADHEYRHAKVPRSRKKEDPELVAAAALASEPRPAAVATVEEPEPMDQSPEQPPDPPADADEAPAMTAAAADDETEPAAPASEEGPVHRRLIRATLPRPEGQVPEWREPEFTVRQPGAGGGRDRKGGQGQGQRRGRGRRRGGGQQAGGGQPFRFGDDANGNRQRGEVNGNRAPSGQRGDGRAEGGGGGRNRRRGSGRGGGKRGGGR